MYDPSYEYGARLDRMMSLISKASFAKLKIEEFTDPVETRVNRRDNDRPENDISKMVETTKANTLEVFAIIIFFLPIYTIEKLHI